MAEHTCDVAVIGAGTAGLSAERAARAEGAKTLLIDDKFAGTVCASVGCMPSKLLIAAAQAAHSVRRAAIFGVTIGDIAVDGRAVMRRLQQERDKFVAATLASINDLPKGTCIKSKASFSGPDKLVLENGDTVTARAIVVAAGSFPFIPKPFEALGDLVLTNRTLFEIEDLPKSLAVIGGGAIGLEIAQAMARLGVDTVLFDQGKTLGGAKSADIQKAIADLIGEEVRVHLGVDVLAKRDGGQARLSWSGDSDGSRLFEKVLVATGRPPQLADLGLHNAGLALDDNGLPAFDRTTLQCGATAIFIAGDVNGDVPFLHEASDEGAIAGRNAANFPKVAKAKRYPVFSLTFTDPPLAILGDAPTEGNIVGCGSYEDQGRAKVEARAKGMVRIYASKPDGQLTGAELFAPGADHMAHLLCWAIQHKETAASLLEMPFYHPTLEEGLRSALRAICKATPAPLPSDYNPPGG